MKFLKYLSLIGLVILVYLVTKIGFNNIISSFESINYIILFAILIIPLILVMQTWKWQAILKIQGINVSFWRLLKIQSIGIYYGTLTPGRAGSLFKSLHLKKELNTPAMELTSSVILERLLDFICVCSLALVGAFIFVSGTGNRSSNLLTAILIVMVIFALGLVVIMNKRYFLFFRRLFNPIIPRKLNDNLDTYIDSFYRRMIKKSDLLYPTFLTVITWLITYLGGYVIVLSLQIKMSFFIFMCLYALGTIISLIPITVGGLGTREFALIALFQPFGIPKEAAFTISILSFLLYLLPLSLFGWVLSLFEK